MKKYRMECSYCDHSFTWAEIPEEFDCPGCGISLTQSEIRWCGHEIDCRGGYFERTKSRGYPDHTNLSIQAQRELAFYEQWDNEHKRTDLLQGLVRGTAVDEEPISDRERYIVNTIIQWLGTHVGFGFIEQAMNQAGYKIVRKDKA